MTNPWMKLPAIGNAEYVLPCDAGDVARHNDKYKKTNFEIVVNEIPEPWLGHVKDAPVVVLQLNPRFCVGPRATINESKHRVIGCEHVDHFWIATNEDWWSRCFKQLAIAVGNKHFTSLTPWQYRAKGMGILKKQICSVEYFPYGSKNFNHSYLRLPSQKYSFDLVKSAIERQAHIVILKGATHWEKVVPELESYPHKTIAKGFGNRGARHITPWSCNTGSQHADFATILERL